MSLKFLKSTDDVNDVISQCLVYLSKTIMTGRTLPSSSKSSWSPARQHINPLNAWSIDCRIFPFWELFTIFENSGLSMKRIFAKRTLRLFWERYPDSEQFLKTWYDTIQSTHWTSPNHIKSFFGSASVLGGGRMVFNIKGNKYRMVVRFNFEKQWAFIRFIGTHSEYDEIDAGKV